MEKPIRSEKPRRRICLQSLSLLKQCSLPTEDIPRENQTFWVVKNDRDIAGVVGIETYGLSGLLRSFAVHPTIPRTDTWEQVFYTLLWKRRTSSGWNRCICVPIPLPGILRNITGFTSARNLYRKAVQQSEEFRSDWPDSTSCMFLPLKKGPVKTAVETYLSGFNCAQAVFSSFAPAMGLGEKEALKITSGFGAGICYKGEICGAVSGAYMALGLKYGRWKSEDAEAREKTYALMREFDKEFLIRNGSLYCNRLLEGDISTPEGEKPLTMHTGLRPIVPAS